MKKGMVFNIQRYSLHDGDGIRTIVFLKGCPLKCEWCSNPESQSIEPTVVFEATRCINCGKCMGICPTGARLNDDKQCEVCGKCVKACPTGALEVIGREMTVDEVVNEVEKDRSFFENSNGGVTISGGEPLQQPDFTRALIEQFKKRYIDVAIETCGYDRWDDLKSIAELCDTVLYDIKHMDSEVHMKFTGVPNELILENAAKVADINQNTIFRIPLLGGINADEENISAVGDYAKEIGVREIHLLPYHRLGEAKYRKLGMEYKCEAYTPDDDTIDKLKRLLEGKGLKVKIGG